MDVESQKTIDEAIDRLLAGLHGLLDRLNGSTLKPIKWGLQLVIPPRKQ